MNSPVDLDTVRHVHVVGIGGAGMSAIAEILLTLGVSVSGSDLADSPAVARLRGLGAEVAVGHDGANVAAPDVITRSTAVRDDNAEVVAGRRRAIPVVSRADMLSALCARGRVAAVAGTHGKTTTTSMVALAGRGAGLDPSFLIGGDVAQLGSGAHWAGDGHWFVVEADESDGTFLRLGAEAAVVTNVEADHLEHYGSLEGLHGAFDRFVDGVEGPRVVCLDDAGSAPLADRHDVITYGTSTGADWRLDAYRPEPPGSRFTIHTPAADGGAIDVSLQVPGRHNASNATAALALVHALGGDLAVAVDAIAGFGGAGRRFERKGSVGGVDFVDDYAHLPTEIAATVGAAAEGGWSRVVAVFQPHRYSRTEELWSEFADCFAGVDELVLTDVYAAGEEPRPGVDGTLILRAVSERHGGLAVAYVADRADLAAHLRDVLRPGDLCLTLGAGNLDTLAGELGATR